MQTPLHDEALQEDGSYDYAPIFEDVAHYVADADYALCCFEGAFSGDGKWTGYPLFHVPDDLAYSLKEVGFDLVNMASNHAMGQLARGHHPHPGRPGRGRAGPRRRLPDAGGTGRQQRHPRQEINGISIAFLNYTYGTNGIPVDGVEFGLNVYTTDYMTYCPRWTTICWTRTWPRPGRWGRIS